ncbi:MAG: restriction endonuclease subunit S [Leuconostoc pseudomesenteroides]|uniref:restriction endonuclease subunit S n=1 Tax=Leuconostoc pseudomesenteroides TaxID=33968 RepID=UPI0039E85039
MYCFVLPWEQRKLGDIGNTFTGLTGKTKKDFGHGDAKFVTYLNVFQNEIATLEQLDSVEIDEQQNKVKKGDVFFTTSSETPEEVGMSSVWTYDIKNIYLNSFTFGYRPIMKLDLKYLASMLRSPSIRKEIIFLAQGISRYNISKTKMMEIKVPVPNISEQKKIGAFFKQLDNTIVQNGRKIDLLKQLKQAYLQQIFSQKLRFAGYNDDWKERKLGELTNSFSGGTPSVGNASYYNGDIPFIRSGEINSDKTELFLTESGLKNSSAKMVSVGDILYALYGATSGEAGISKINGAINQAILAIKPRGAYSSHFIIQWLKLKKQNIIDKYLQGGQGNLSGSIVKDLILSVPNFEEQQKIGSFFKQLDSLITLHQQKLNLLKKQKQAYLQKMFI